MIADDLTGACDTGVQFARRGFSSIVSLDPDPAKIVAADVTVVTTNSRSDSPVEARRKAARACRSLLQLGFTNVYKKIDSTLKGNPAAEIAAVLAECGAPFAVVAPAFPEMGRSVAGGRLRVAGSEIDVDVAALLREQGAERVVSIGPRNLASFKAESGTLAVIDSETRGDLARIARAAVNMRPPPLLAGSAALARELAALFGGPESQARVSFAGASAGPVILCIGSANPVTVKQMERLAARGAVIAPLDSACARSALSAGSHLIATIGATEPADPTLGALPELLEEFGVRGLALSGGDTALMVCRALGVNCIELETEIVTGIPWGRLMGGRWSGLPVAAKAGGFGDSDALVAVADFLSRQPEVCP